MQLGNLTIPETLRGGRYTVGSILGQGGMAVVAKAHDNELGVDRAVKVVYATGRNRATLRRRLKSEARAMAKLHHPNILSIHDVGEEGELDYVIMDLARGGSLQDRLAESEVLRPSIAIQYIIQVLSALAAAHSNGVVHRDVKPHNILLDGSGRALLADFGIAMLVGEDRGTKSGVAMGSLAFMPPEQRLDAAKVGPQADVYACGSTLFNLLTGENPVDLFLASEKSPRWAKVPEPLRPVLMKACRMQPDERWATAGDMAYALLEVLRSESEGFHTAEGPLEPVFPAPSLSLSQHSQHSQHSTAGIVHRGTLLPPESDPATAHAVEVLGLLGPPTATHELTRTSQDATPDERTPTQTPLDRVEGHTWSPTVHTNTPTRRPGGGAIVPVIGLWLLGAGVALSAVLVLALLWVLWPASPEVGGGRFTIDEAPVLAPAPVIDPQPSAPSPPPEVPAPGPTEVPRPAVVVTGTRPPEPVPAEPSPVVPSTLAGSWEGTMGGAFVDLKLQGADGRLRGTMTTSIGTRASKQGVAGTYDPKSQFLSLRETGTAPARFELTLANGKLTGSVIKPTGGRGPLVLERP